MNDPKCMEIDSSALAETFSKAHQQFAAYQQYKNTGAFLALPCRWSSRSDGWFDGSLILVARPFDKTYRYSTQSVIQAIIESPQQPRQIICGTIGLSTKEQTREILIRWHEEPKTPLVLKSESFVSCKFQTQTENLAEVELVETPIILRPLQLYSVTGGKLAQLLL